MAKKLKKPLRKPVWRTLTTHSRQQCRKCRTTKKIITICSLAVIAVIAIILVYIYAFRTPGIQKANDTIGAADLQLALGNDSVAMAQYMDLADNGSYEAANRAALQSAILLYKDGKYEEALKYAEKILRQGRNHRRRRKNRSRATVW